MRSRALLFAAACVAVALCATAGPARADDLQSLSRDVWRWRAIGQPINGDDIPRIRRPEGWTPYWSAAAVAARRAELARFEARWKALAAVGTAGSAPSSQSAPSSPSAPPAIAEQVDYRLLGSLLARVHWELDGARPWRRDPGFYVAQTVGSVVDAMLPPPPFTARRSRDLVARLAAFPRVLRDGEANLDQMVRPFAGLAVESLDGIGPHLRAAMAAVRPRLDAESAGRLDAATDAAVTALEAYRAWLSARMTAMPAKPATATTAATAGDDAGVAVGRDAYLFFLRKVALLPFTPEQILAMGRQEWARCVAAEALEAQRNHGLPELPLFASQEAQIAAARRDETAVRAYLERKGILTVPAWMPAYLYRPLPGYIEPLADFGEGTDFPLDPPLQAGPSQPEAGLESTRYIPPPSTALGYFALSMARDPRADMVHEGIPGHGFQLALSRRHPDEIRRHWYDSGVNEGLGFYAEEMMLEMGLFDDSPRSREMIWNYARLRALRVEVDVRLALGTFTIAQAADYLQAAVPMDAATARAEAAAFAAAPGFAIGYQIGKLQIVDLLAEARRRQGAAFDLRAFHDSVWRNGNVPLVLQRWEMLGLRDQLDALDRD